MAQAICAKLSEFRKLSAAETEKEETRRDKEKEMCLAKIEEEIDGLLLKVADANDTLIKYINGRIEGLEAEKTKLEEEMALEEEKRGRNGWEIEAPEKLWEQLSFEDRQAVTDVLIEKVRIAEGRAEIVWRI